MTISKTSQISEVLELVQNLGDSKTLVVFDVDDVLITKNDPALRDQDSLIKKFLWNYPLKIFNLPNFYEKVAVDSKSKLMEDANTIELIKFLEESQIKTIALTHCPHNEISNSDLHTNFADWRYNDLKDLGVDFCKLSGNYDDFYLNNGSRFFNGILFAHNSSLLGGGLLAKLFGRLDKGKCLEQLFDKMELRKDISKVVFIDDLESNIVAVESFCKRNDIEFHGVHYTKKLEFVDQVTSEEICEKLQFFFDNDHWIPEGC